MKHDSEELQVNIQHIFQSILSNIKSRVKLGTLMSKSAVSIWKRWSEFCAHLNWKSRIAALCWHFFWPEEGGWEAASAVCALWGVPDIEVGVTKDIRGCLSRLAALLCFPAFPFHAALGSTGVTHPSSQDTPCKHLLSGSPAVLENWNRTHTPGIWGNFTDISMYTRVSR